MLSLENVGSEKSQIFSKPFLPNRLNEKRKTFEMMGQLGFEFFKTIVQIKHIFLYLFYYKKFNLTKSN